MTHATATIIADSISPDGNRLTTFQLRYWRALHSEMMTHRVFSRNAGSSRAIPVATMLKQVWNDPAGPSYWGSNKPGMQAGKEVTGARYRMAQWLWKWSGRLMCLFAWAMMKIGLHKQVANRILEPWQYIEVIVSSTEWINFYELRRHKDAQPEIQRLADAMFLEQVASVPKFLAWGAWHLPWVLEDEMRIYPLRDLVRFSTARNARVSYLTHGDKFPSIVKDLKLHDRLVKAKPIHASPAEHVAVAMPGRHRNFEGWRQYRVNIEENIPVVGWSI